MRRIRVFSGFKCARRQAVDPGLQQLDVLLADRFERLVDLHGKDAQRTEDFNKYVYPDLGHVYLELKKVLPAKTVLSPLIELDGQAPSRRTVIDWARSISGSSSSLST